MQGTRDVGEAHGADKHGYRHLQQEDANYLEVVKTDYYSAHPYSVLFNATNK